MPHCDPATQALAALGEEIPAADATHLRTCPRCAGEVAELTAVVTLGRQAPAALPDVPAQIWSAIRAELSADRPSDAAETHPSRAPRDTTGPATGSQGPGSQGPGNQATGPVAAGTPDPAVVPLDSRRRRRSPWAIAGIAAAVGALFGGAVVWSAVDSGGTGPRSQERFVAQAVLAPLPGASVSTPGHATVMDSADGEVIRVDARSLPAGDGFYEVWLLDADATRLVALGALPAGSVGTFTVPPGLSLADYPVVDISLEAYDGDPSHSTHSLMRGTLQA